MSRRAVATSTHSVQSLQMLLSQTLGWEKSGEVIELVTTEMGLTPGDAIEDDDLHEILDRLGEMRGLTGIAARFARRRLEDSGSLPAERPSSGKWSIGTRERAASGTEFGAQRARPAADQRIGFLQVVSFLASSLGEERAREAVLGAASELGFDPESLTRAQALTIMEQLSEQAGLVGVVARLAKARLRLTQLRP